MTVVEFLDLGLGAGKYSTVSKSARSKRRAGANCNVSLLSHDGRTRPLSKALLTMSASRALKLLKCHAHDHMRTGELSHLVVMNPTAPVPPCATQFLYYCRSVLRIKPLRASKSRT